MWDEGGNGFFTREKLIAIATIFTLVAVGLGLTELIRHFVAPAPPSGDTPIVVVGASIKSKSGSKNVLWQQDKASEKYHVMMQNPVASISMKQKADKDPDDPLTDESDANTDRVHVEVSDTTAWEIDEFADGFDHPVARITPDPASKPRVNLSVYDRTAGLLCPEGNKLNRLSILPLLLLPLHHPYTPDSKTSLSGAS